MRDSVNELITNKMYMDCRYIDSRKVAPMIGIEHTALLAGIAHMVDILSENGQDVSEKFIARKRGGNVVWYHLSRSGCDAVAVALTPDETTRLLFINQYTDTFRRKERKLQQLMSEDWQRKRSLNKSEQKDFSDVAKELTEYAKQNGSKNSGRYYTNFNRLMNRTVGLEDGDRDMATAMQLDKLSAANTWAGKIIKQGIAKGDDYHDIYRAVKTKTAVLKEFWEMTTPTLP